MKTGLRSKKMLARSGIPAITGCATSLSTSMMEPLEKKSYRPSSPTTFRTGRWNSSIAKLLA